MALYDLDAPRIPQSSTLLSRIGARLTAALHALEYCQMRAVLSQMTDENLDVIGITRSEISAHAHKCVYESGED